MYEVNKDSWNANITKQESKTLKALLIFFV